MTTPAAGTPATTPGTPTEQGQAPTGQPDPAAPVAPQQPQPAGQTPGAEDVSTLPDWAQKLITKARGEAASARTTAKQQAADEARTELAKQIGQALGLVQDDKPDPAKLTEQLTAQTAAARQSAVQLAVYRAAGKAGANADALLDSVTFANAVKELDPAAADFAAQVEQAITTAVAGNPLLKAAPSGPARSGGQFTGAPGAPDQITEDQLKTMTPEQIVEAQAKGQLRNLLGG
ncbi:hypothetical protein GCM10010174_70050 [Kutzneria viridogrisea]|uniref:Scaffolding protein n=1 Tax=Kutzneria viridogrisea TaxID=47990 RepID=A0ABR6BAW3_9PSEU|nr:hypothetical protein [Kutzneria viridogrisea]